MTAPKRRSAPLWPRFDARLPKLQFHFEGKIDRANGVRQAADRLRSLGAIVEDVSVPMHMDGPAIWTAIALEGLQAQMMALMTVADGAAMITETIFENRFICWGEVGG